MHVASKLVMNILVFSKRSYHLTIRRKITCQVENKLSVSSVRRRMIGTALETSNGVRIVIVRASTQNILQY